MGWVGWFAVFALGGVVITTLSVLLGLPTIGAALMVPMVLTVAAMFFSSVYFTFRDSFVHTDQSPDEVHP